MPDNYAERIKKAFGPKKRDTDRKRRRTATAVAIALYSISKETTANNSLTLALCENLCGVVIELYHDLFVLVPENTDVEAYAKSLIPHYIIIGAMTGFQQSAERAEKYNLAKSEEEKEIAEEYALEKSRDTDNIHDEDIIGQFLNELLNVKYDK
jgi:hypothetical protein